MGGIWDMAILEIPAPNPKLWDNIAQAHLTIEPTPSSAATHVCFPLTLLFGWTLYHAVWCLEWLMFLS